MSQSLIGSMVPTRGVQEILDNAFHFYLGRCTNLEFPNNINIAGVGHCHHLSPETGEIGETSWYLASCMVTISP